MASLGLNRKGKAGNYCFPFYVVQPPSASIYFPTATYLNKLPHAPAPQQWMWALKETRQVTSHRYSGGGGIPLF